MLFSDLRAAGRPPFPVGLGTFNTVRSSNELQRVLDAGVDAGVNFIDTAESYGNGAMEVALGQWLAGRRDRVLVATKWGGGIRVRKAGTKTGGRNYILEALEGSLKRLSTDYIDLYQYHHVDPNTPFLETAQVLDDLIRRGKVRAWGVSNMNANQFCDMSNACEAHGLVQPLSSQNHYSLMNRKPEKSLLPILAKNHVALLAYFPLERGLLSGKYRAGTPLPAKSRLGRSVDSPTAQKLLGRENLAMVDRLLKIANRHARSLAELSLAWILADSRVSCAISGASRPEQISQNATAASWRITEDERREISEATGLTA